MKPLEKVNSCEAKRAGDDELALEKVKSVKEQGNEDGSLQRKLLTVCLAFVLQEPSPGGSYFRPPSSSLTSPSLLAFPSPWVSALFSEWECIFT